MKYAWRALVVIGAMLVLAALMMETTVDRVYNVGLLQRQQLFIILGCALLLGGIVLYAVKKLKQTKEEDEEEVRRSRAATEARAQARAKALQAVARTDRRVGVALSRLAPGTDAWPARLLVGVLIGGLWGIFLAFPAAGAYRGSWGGMAWVAGLVFSFWRLPAITVLRRLMLTNAVLHSLSAAVVMEVMTSNASFDLSTYLAVVGGLVAVSLVAFLILNRRSRPEPRAEGKSLSVRKVHVLGAGAILMVLSLLVPPYELTDYAEGGVKVTTTQYVPYGSTKEDLRGAHLMAQLVLLYWAAGWLYIRAKA